MPDGQASRVSHPRTQASPVSRLSVPKMLVRVSRDPFLIEIAALSGQLRDHFILMRESWISGSLSVKKKVLFRLETLVLHFVLNRTFSKLTFRTALCDNIHHGSPPPPPPPPPPPGSELVRYGSKGSHSFIRRLTGALWIVFKCNYALNHEQPFQHFTYKINKVSITGLHIISVIIVSYNFGSPQETIALVLVKATATISFVKFRGPFLRVLLAPFTISPHSISLLSPRALIGQLTEWMCHYGMT